MSYGSYFRVDTLTLFAAAVAQRVVVGVMARPSPAAATPSLMPISSPATPPAAI